MDGRGWSSGLADSYVTRLAMVYMEIRYGIQGEYLCCTFGARVLHFWGQGAALFLALLFVSLYSGFSVGQTFWFSFDHDCTLAGQMGFKTDFAWKKREYIFFRTLIGRIGRIFILHSHRCIALCKPAATELESKNAHGVSPIYFGVFSRIRFLIISFWFIFWLWLYLDRTNGI